MQHRFCNIILFLGCLALCASCSSPPDSESNENELVADSTFQIEVLDKLDSLETRLGILAAQKDSQKTEVDLLAAQQAFRQELIHKLDSVETQLAELTPRDSTAHEQDSGNGLFAWLRAPFRPKAQAEPDQDAAIMEFSPGDIADDSMQLAILQRLDSLQTQLDSLNLSTTVTSQPGLVGSDTSLAQAVFSDSASALTAAGSEAFDERSRDDLLNPDLLRKYWGRIFLSILVFVVFLYLIRGITWTLDKLAEQSATRRLLFKRITPVAKILLWIFAIYIIIVYIFEVSGTALLSAGAATGVALAFAGQDVLKNIFGGLIIIADQPFQVGDKITIGGTYGEVVSIGLRSTRIVTSDDNLVTVPNSQVVESQVSNANAGQLHCQVVVDLYLPGWADATKAKSIAYSAAATSKYVYLDKPIVVVVQDDFKEMSLIRLSVKAYVFDCLNELAFKSEVTETSKMEFLRHDMLTPFAYNFKPTTKTNRDGPEDAEAVNP